MRAILNCTLLLLLIYPCVNELSARQRIVADTNNIDSLIEERVNAPLLLSEDSIPEGVIEDKRYVPKKRKLKAVLLSILLGHFGVHRIYLGTTANVPVAYSLTLGGGLGLLPLIDTIMILQSKDLSEFSNNDKVIMWSKQKPTPP